MLGFIFHEKSPRFISVQKTAEIITDGTLRVGVFTTQSADGVLQMMHDAQLDIAQLHGDQDEEFCLEISNALGPERVMKVLWPERFDTAKSFQQAMEDFAPLCGRFLLDAGSSCGGHGQEIKSSWLDQVEFPRPWMLAGGLGPENLQKAFALTPAGVDLNSNIELSPGIKDPKRVEESAEMVHKYNKDL